MIYITGDTHGDPLRFKNHCMGDEKWSEQDYLLVCGDFGYLFHNHSAEQEFLDFLETKPYTICFCDGNHENFHAIYAYPQELWNGGSVHRIRKNIFHLMRGEIYCIDGLKIFAMGGAYSIDRYVRTLNRSYWEEEIPTSAEYRTATRNLAAHNYEVDLIITHTAPREIIRRMGKYPDAHDMELTGFLEWVMYDVKFKQWYFGHWHIDQTIHEKFHGVYLEVVRVDSV